MTSFNKKDFNAYVDHPLQAFEWGEFRTKTGVKVIRKFVDDAKTPLAFQLTIHKIPRTSWTVGYLPKGTLPTPQLLQELYTIGKQEKCIFIQLEPRVYAQEGKEKMDQLMKHYPLVPSARPLFTKYTFELNLDQSDEDLLKNSHSKTRYNIRVAQKKGVEVKENSSEKAFQEYLRLTHETTTRQKFYAHSVDYHKKMWETLQHDADKPLEENSLSAHLLTAVYNKKTLVSWILFVFKDTLYYPYGASSSENREVMASNLMMWEAIQFGKKHGLKKFDMWGALSENPDSKDPWFGFHRFKQGYGPQHVEFVGSYDFVINPFMYKLFKIANAVRWLLLSLKK